MSPDLSPCRLPYLLSGMINWNELDTALPCFLTICLMPFTGEISSGIVAGVLLG